MSIHKRMVAKIAGGGVAALAATTIAAAPSALADPDTPAPPAPDTATQAAPGPVPHLSSPDNLPPGTSVDPVAGTDSAGVSYAKSVWEAIQDHDITWRQGLVLLAQRPMDPNATPPPGMAAGPQPPGPNPPATP